MLPPLIFHFMMMALFVSGLLCIFSTRRVQEFGLRYNRNWFPGVPNPFLGWMRTEGYVIYLRFMGRLFVIISAGLEFVVWRFAVPGK